MTTDSHDGAERLPALLDDELSPEVALVDPDVAERARDALPDITLTEIRLSLSLKIEQVPTPAVPAPVSEPIALPEPAPVPTPAPALVRPADAPPPSYKEIRRVFHEPRLGPRRRRRSVLAALVILGVAAGTALALPRALDGPSSQTSANRRSSNAAVAPPAHRSKSKGASKAKRRSKAKKPKAHMKGAPTPTHHTRPPRKAKPASKKRATAPPAPVRHISKRKHKKPGPAVRPRALPDFVWAPVKNARGYLVEFHAGSKVVLRRRTRVARLHVLARQLHRGHYRWLVWQVGKSGSPIGRPLVDSTVRVR